MRENTEVLTNKRTQDIGRKERIRYRERRKANSDLHILITWYSKERDSSNVTPRYRTVGVGQTLTPETLIQVVGHRDWELKRTKLVLLQLTFNRFELNQSYKWSMQLPTFSYSISRRIEKIYTGIISIDMVR